MQKDRTQNIQYAQSLRLTSLASLILFACILSLLAACSKQAAQTIPQPSPDSQIASIKVSSENVLTNDTKGITDTAKQAAAAAFNAAEAASQTVFVPVPQGNNVISAEYRAPCSLKNYNVLNSWCSAKNFFHNQGTLISWYLSYPKLFVIALILFIIVFWIIWNSRK